MTTMVNPFELDGQWYKANLHAHTTESDGVLTPEERVAQYRKAGYNVLALTDHYKTHDVGEFAGNAKFLVVSGIEFHPPCTQVPGQSWWHLVGLGVPHGFTIREGVEANRCITKVRRAGGEVILAHPAWCGQGYHDFKHLKKVIAIEVYNSTCDRAGRASSENQWAIALDRRWRLPAVASDDCHCGYGDDVLESWTWLKMPALSTAHVIEAIRTGACYASCGPTVHDFRLDGDTIRVRCSPAAKINLVGMPVQGVRRRAAEGKTITTFGVDTSTLRGWPWPYVRAVVTDTRGRKAWTNPIYPT
jgi:hypothetical protein